MEYILKNGIVYDPANEVNGEKMDVMFKDGLIVDNVSADAKVLDVTDKIVMPAGVDPHAHVAGPKLVVGRLYRPEVQILKIRLRYCCRSSYASS